MEQPHTLPSRWRWRSSLAKLAGLALWAVLPLLVGILLAFALVPIPQVGIIRIEDVIWPENTAHWSELVERARTDSRIRAVVLQVNSPGGSVTPTEEIYYRLLELRETKPLVVAIDDVAASGGYYLAAAGDRIFAKPSSIVGNIGVINLLPSIDEQRFISEDYVSSGPFKFSGGSRGDYVRQLELAKLSFLEAVFAQRSARLRADRQKLAGGEIFMGTQALQLGLIDELGSNSTAIAKAAELAHLRHYQVVDVSELVDEGKGQSERVPPAGEKGSVWQPGLYYLYIEPQASHGLARRP